jgi:hypothetical protein
MVHLSMLHWFDSFHISPVFSNSVNVITRMQIAIRRYDDAFVHWHRPGPTFLHDKTRKNASFVDLRPPSDAPFTQSRCYTTCQYMSHMSHHNRLCVLGLCPMYLLPPTPGSASHSLNRVNTAMAVPFSGGRKPTPRSVRIVSMQVECHYTATGAGGGARDVGS